MIEEKNNNIVQPISFADGRLAGKNENINPSNKMLISNQMDPVTGYRGKLRYEMEKAQMELLKQDASLHRKLQYEQELNDLKIRYQTMLKMMSCTIYEDSASDLIFALTNQENHVISSKKLLNVKGYQAKMYVSYYPITQSVLGISWRGLNQNRLIFNYDAKEIDPLYFMKKLKSHGVMFLVSGRTEKQAATALLAFTVKNAETKEISGVYGWNRLSSGSWHFASTDEMLMEGLKNGK